MRTTKLNFIQRSALKVVAPALSLAGIAFSAAPGQAQAADDTADFNFNFNNNCSNDWDCFNGFDSVGWCQEGQCQFRDRIERACQLPGNDNRCWWDGQCRDGDPNTVTWCDDFDWQAPNWWLGAGRCHAAPRDGSACDGGSGIECRRNRDCRDDDPRTKNWCHEGQCYEADRNDAACVDEGTSCSRRRDCRDGDSNTYDWCFRGECYHAPINGGSCEPGDTCVEADCPDDGNDCTEAACVNDACAQQNVANGTQCDDGSGTCNDGACEPVVNCVEADCPDDGNECTQAACVDDACTQVNVADDTSCNNDAGTCQDGVCQDVCDPANCPDDGNDCTRNICNADNSCGTEPVQSGELCAGGAGTCDAQGVCSVCMPSDCDDQNECTLESCNGANCESDNAQDGTACNNGDGVCSAGQCVACIDDTQCSNGVACDGAETCVNNQCQAGTAVDCASIECKAGSCSEPNGDCTYTDLPDSTVCADGDGVCISGACTVCDPDACADSNECTASECDGATNQCVNNPVANGTSCNSGQGQCNDGACVECVADSDCAGATNCTQAATCVDNACVDGAPVVCADDGNVCTAHACDPASGCVTTNVADGISCGSNGETCQAGVCETAVNPPNCEPIQVVLEHTKRGAINNPQSGETRWKVVGTGYQVRYIRGANGDIPLTNSYNCWDTSGLSGTVMSAYVEMFHSDNSYDSPDASETVAFVPFDQVGCNAPELDNPSLTVPSNWQALFDDAIDGPVLAEFTATESDQGRTESFPLNAAGVASLQAALGSSQGFGLGGILTTADGAGPGQIERVFRGTDGTSGEAKPPTRLVITIQPDSCGSDQRVLNPVDVGYFTRGFNTDTNAVQQSFHYESPDKEHKAMPVGNLNINNFILGKGNIERRPYSVWDVSGINNAVAAKLRIWNWQPSLANNFSGAYTSDDPSETVGLFSVDNFTPEQIINAPFEDDFNHTLDIPIFEDLGAGTLYGERVHTIDDELVGLGPAFRAPPGTSCAAPIVEDPGSPCGKWLEYELNADALAAINSTNGTWAMGHAMTTIDAGPLQKEWTNNGILIDLNPRKTGVYPAYLTPEPQLVIRTAN